MAPSASHIGFHVTLSQLLSDSVATLIPITVGGLLLIAAVIIWMTGKPQFRTMMGVVLAVSALFILSLSASTMLSMVGSGWSVNGKTLSVKTGFGSATWPLADIKATYVTANRDYRPVLRTGGYSGSHLQSGHFRLQNGDNVLLFRYGQNPSLLLTLEPTSTQSGSTALDLLISSPNVDALYSAVTAASGRQVPPRVGVIRPSSSGQSLIRLLIVIIISLAAVAWQGWMARRYYPLLPNRMASHWNFQGEVDNYMPKRFVVWIGPVMALLLAAISTVVSVAASSLTLLVPFVLLQALFIFIIHWMYQRNLGTSN